MKLALLRRLTLLAATLSVLPPLWATQSRTQALRNHVVWGAAGVSGGAIRLVRIQLDSNTYTTTNIPNPTGSIGAMVVPAALSPDEQSAAITMDVAGGDPVLIVRNIRGSNIAQIQTYWLPLKDPMASNPSCAIQGAPCFLDDNEIWTIETPGNTRLNRLARYRLDAASATFLGAADLDDPQNPAHYLPKTNWMIRDAKAIFLQQRQSGQGLELVRFNSAGALVQRQVVDPLGYSVYHAAFEGIQAVSARPTWGFMQYGVSDNGKSIARLVDLANGYLTAPQDVRADRRGRFSRDARLALFAEYSLTTNKTLLPVALPPTIQDGMTLATLPTVSDFFCSGDSIACGGSMMVNAPYGCSGGMVHRAYLDAVGNFSIDTISTNTGNGPPFEFYGAPGGPLAFYDSTYGNVYAATGASQNLLQFLNVDSLNYCTISQTLTVPGSQLYF